MMRDEARPSFLPLPEDLETGDSDAVPRPVSSQKWRPRHPLGSFRHAIEGILFTFRTQRNMRFHVLAAVVVIFAGLLVRLPRTEMLLLVGAIALVLLCEMFNTAIEATVDMITQDYHPTAKFVKDVAAGAVLIAAVNAAIIGGALFVGQLQTLPMVRARLLNPPNLMLFALAFLVLMVTTLAGKALGKKGTLLQGGVVSGHSAIAFFLATTLVWLSGDWFVSIVALLLAAFVLQSRLEAKFHTLREVVAGALLAILITSLVYGLAPFVARHFLSK